MIAMRIEIMTPKVAPIIVATIGSACDIDVISTCDVDVVVVIGGLFIASITGLSQSPDMVTGKLHSDCSVHSLFKLHHPHSNPVPMFCPKHSEQLSASVRQLYSITV